MPDLPGSLRRVTDHHAASGTPAVVVARSINGVRGINRRLGRMAGGTPIQKTGARLARRRPDDRMEQPSPTEFRLARCGQ